MFPARFELRVLGGRDNHYTTETTVHNKGRVRGIIGILSLGRTQIHTPTVVQGSTLISIRQTDVDTLMIRTQSRVRVRV